MKLFATVFGTLITLITFGFVANSCASTPPSVPSVIPSTVKVVPVQLPDCIAIAKQFVESKTKMETMVPPQATADGGMIFGLIDEVTGIIRVVAVVNDKIGSELSQQMPIEKRGTCEVAASGWVYNVYSATLKKPGQEANSQ